MATESSQRAMPFSAGFTWWPGGSILGAKFPPLKCMTKIVTSHISQTVRPKARRNKQFEQTNMLVFDSSYEVWSKPEVV